MRAHRLPINAAKPNMTTGSVVGSGIADVTPTKVPPPGGNVSVAHGWPVGVQMPVAGSKMDKFSGP